MFALIVDIFNFYFIMVYYSLNKNVWFTFSQLKYTDLVLTTFSDGITIVWLNQMFAVQACQSLCQ
jgi:hypothetical protein